MIYDGLWWFMMIYDGLWCFMMVYDALLGGSSHLVSGLQPQL